MHDSPDALALPADRSLFIDDAARLLGVSRRTVYYRIREGRLRTIRTKCGSQRVLLSSVEALRREIQDTETGRVARGADPQDRARRLETEPLAFQVEALSRDAELPGGGIDASVGRAERGADHLALDAGEGRHQLLAERNR